MEDDVQSMEDDVQNMEDDVPEPGTSYDVFINQRGADVSKTLGSLIYHSLREFDLRVFLSDNEPQSGDTLLPEILSAIGNASVHIAIFSESYAESRSCLNELCWILKSSTFIPVFCNVKPLDLRDIERGRYAESFHKHQHSGSVTREAEKRWKRALNEASQISGHEYNTSESDCGECLDRIVEIVLDKVEWEPLMVDRDPVMERPLVRPDAVIKAPKLSYEALNRAEKETFLDIGCFFVEEETELVIRVMQGLGCVDPWGYLQSLCQKCLISFQTKQSDHETEVRASDPENRRYGYYYSLPPKRSYEIVRMQDQVRELARNIAREDFCYPLRLSCSDDLQKIVELQDGEVSCWIRGIRSAEGDGLPDYYPNYISGVGVCLLAVEDPNQNLWSFLKKCDGLLGDLVWLRLRLRNFSAVYLPSTVSLQTLRVLELKVKAEIEVGESHVEGVERFFRDFVAEPPLELTELKIELGVDVPKFSSIERWSFHDDPLRFWNRSIPEQAPECLGRFVEWIGSMRNLHKIVLKNFKFLQTLPENLGDLENLTHLDLSGCKNLNELPNSFSRLMQLKFLSLQGCMFLSIPEDIFGEISSLEYVDFEGCCKLEDLPVGISNQWSLRYLNLLCTPLVQLPDNLALLDNLEQLRIGSSELTELPPALSNLSSLTELILMSCNRVKEIPSEAIGWPSIKVLGIYSMDVPSLPFKGCMSFLRDLTVKETQICEICIPEIVCPILETVNLSDNSLLTKIDDLPSTIKNLHLHNCSKLQTFTNLSSLAKLEFLDISRCSGLETLNVEGMRSLKEIKAIECWKLQRIHGLTQRREQLNCLQISTDSVVIWNDICKFWTSPSEISTVILTTRTDDDTNNDEEVMRNIVSNLEDVEVFDEFPAESRGDGFYQRLENSQSYAAVFMCFITYGPDCFFQVSFESDKTFVRCYRAFGGDGRRIHVMFWTEDSSLLRNHDIVIESSKPAPGESVGNQWIVMLKNKTSVFELFNQVISALQRREGFLLKSPES